MNGKNIFFATCNLGKGEASRRLLGHFSNQTGATVYAANHTLKAGFKYDASAFLSIPYSILELMINIDPLIWYDQAKKDKTFMI